MPYVLPIAVAALCLLTGIAITVWGHAHGLWAWRAWRRASIAWMVVACLWCGVVVWATLR